MKSYIFKFYCCLLMFPLVVFAEKGKIKESKIYHETYDVSKDSRLSLHNRYGNINIETWHKKTIEIEVQVISTGKDKDEVLERLEEVNIQISGNKSHISASTEIERKTGFFSWFNNNSASLRIDYIVKMPETNFLELKNSYGDVFIDKLKGNAKLDVNYGNIKAGELWGEDNYVELDYSSGSGSEFEFINSGTIDADYSTVYVTSADVLTLDTDYSNIRLGEVNKLKFDMDYGKIKFKKAYILSGEADYVNVRIEELNVSADLDLDYGSLGIEHITKNVQKLSINADYTAIDLVVDPTLAFQFEVDLSYANLRAPKDVEYRKEVQKNLSKYYQGYMHKDTAETIINIDSDYGDVKISTF